MASSPGVVTIHDTLAGGTYDSDEEILPRNSPMMKPQVVKLDPSASPPPASIPIIDPTQGDVVLLKCMDGGRRPEISQQGLRALESSDDEQSEVESDVAAEGDSEDGVRSNTVSPASPQLSRYTGGQGAPSAVSEPESVDLRSLASNALAAVSKATDGGISKDPMHDTQPPRRVSLTDTLANSPAISRTRVMSMPTVPRPVLAPPPIPPYPMHSAQEMYSPKQQQKQQQQQQQPLTTQVLMHPNSIRSPMSLSPGAHGELAPIQMASPRSDASYRAALPSIRSQLLKELQALSGPPQELAVRQSPQSLHSPPTGQLRLGAISGNHASPPVSPDEVYRNNMPSPANTLHAMSPYSHPGLSSSAHRPSLGRDYSNLKWVTTSQGLTPPGERIVDRMSSDSATIPSSAAQFVCKYQGCAAPPFQTQYLLNSHANVHSSNRPHYCPVKGCPRSEGGKGFKRKNEMIRHGLVHDSPGYVCPFCPDREHKYPRPDNLQRHVRVHHVDKDKDDPALRDVLSQRPDGPNRGRRRRGPV
ncbi:hypothetical protein F5Y17DRAFT_68987 [Xylariaceae sp. FL0594]|nr:hypothetical protein F5Y17DRAFT_68987 [Xylariaceae sp. FL0594]